MHAYPRGIAVIGLGYIGLPTAAALATQGVRVHGVDTDPERVASINRGEAPFVEPDLAVAVSGAVSQGHLTAASEVPTADAFIITVPTPILPDRSADLSYIHAAVRALAPKLRGGEVLILESTSPPGTTQAVSDWLADLRPDLRLPGWDDQRADVHIAHCPERVLPGRIMIELVTNDRVVGGLTPDCADAAGEVYKLFCKGEISLTDAGSAEMSKLAENAFRDVNLAFANELSLVCDHLGLNTWEIIRAANRHPRVNILSPGPGVGGHCIAVDPWFIVSAAPEQSRLIKTAREINDLKPDYVVDRIVERASRFYEPRVACLGLSFKANVDDLRGSPAVAIVRDIASAVPGGTVYAVEPHIDKLPHDLSTLPNLVLMDLRSSIEAADIVVLLVDHNAFRPLNRSLLEGKICFDTRGMWQ